jgi:hypothetical protein
VSFVESEQRVELVLAAAIGGTVTVDVYGIEAVLSLEP